MPNSGNRSITEIGDGSQGASRIIGRNYGPGLVGAKRRAEPAGTEFTGSI